MSPLSGQRSSQRNSITLLEVLLVAVLVGVGVVATIVALAEIQHAREVAEFNYQQEYRPGFMEGVLFAVRQGNDGGMMCWLDDSPHNDGFDDGRRLVGCRLAWRRDMSLTERIEFAQDEICRNTEIDMELQDQTLASLQELHQRRNR